MMTRLCPTAVLLFLAGCLASVVAAEPANEREFERYGLFERTAPRPSQVEPEPTTLPLRLVPGTRIALIGNTLFERSQEFGHFEAFLHQQFPKHRLVVRNLAWSADTIDLQPRPANFADIVQHLHHERIDVVFAAFGFNESFAGEAGLEAFRRKLNAYVAELGSLAFNGRTAPRIVLVSPIANENTARVNAADRNNPRIQAYADAMRDVARERNVGFADVFTPTHDALRSPGTDLTINGCHLTKEGDAVFAAALFRAAFGAEPAAVHESLRRAVVDKDRQFFRRYRPLNTFYYTGDRNKDYGYLDFLPAMRNFDLMVANRDRRLWELAQGRDVPVDDSNVPPLPAVAQSRGVNEWLPAEDERKAFRVDPRFEVNLFSGEEQFPELANPIQMRWDARGRLWVSCSGTYPHVYPGHEPNDRLVVLEDTDGDGRADRSSIFADRLHVPLSFEFGDGGVYVSEQPQLTFLQDTDGDGRADRREVLLSGFGTEDSHHALHDFIWTPDGELLIRESIFHHSQIETPYGPVRQRNSGWFRFEPRSHRLTSFGSYPSTNPWGVTFDDWGQHVASHPIFAAAFHSLDPPYPQQHPAPVGLRAYSGTCGQEFVDGSSFPPELAGHFIKVRYKPTNRVEIHQWIESEFGYDEQYVGDLLFSTNLSFIPVDIRFGPRGDLFVCDWYNPVKGHAQYSLRDERRDRHSGRIWRITAKGRPLVAPPRFDGAPIAELLDLLKRPESRFRAWARRELREREVTQVRAALDAWVARLDRADRRFRHHQLEALWTYRTIDAADSGASVRPALLRDVLACDDHHARAAAVRQLRWWHAHLPDAVPLLRRAANDPRGLVRMEAVIAASYVGSRDALDALLDVLKHPRGGHLQYAINGSLASHTLRRHWEGNARYDIETLLKKSIRQLDLTEPKPTPAEVRFDRQPDVKVVSIGCQHERMLFTVRQIVATTGQPLKIVFTNSDATDHNLVFLRPDALEEVGLAANAMAKDPRHASSDFLPASKQSLILHASPMIGPTRRSQVHVFRFRAPSAPGVYPYVCTFPGHWIVMNGELIVVRDLQDVASVLASRQPQIVKEWTLADFPNFATRRDEASRAKGMLAFVKARCHQCHVLGGQVIGGHGVNLGPDLAESVKRLQGEKLLAQILEPSREIHPRFQSHRFALSDGRVITGLIRSEDATTYHVLTNLLTPDHVTPLRKADVEEKQTGQLSSMPTGLLDRLTKDEILHLVSFLEAGDFKLPEHLRATPGH